MEDQKKTLIDQFLKSLSEKELKGYQIAKDHLQSSFSIEKSNGFLEWKKKKDEEKECK